MIDRREFSRRFFGMFAAVAVLKEVPLTPPSPEPEQSSQSDEWGSIVLDENYNYHVVSKDGQRILSSPDGINWTCRSA